MTTEEQFELNRIAEQFRKCDYPIVSEKIKEESIMLEMADGICLKTIVMRPQTEGRIPVIVMRTCYPQNDYIYQATAKEYCRRGFGYIYQYCRGTGGSEGEWEPNVNERPDGKVTIDWVCSLLWVKNAGYYGCSYLALTGWVIADILPDKVKTMYLTHYGTFRFTSVYQDGMFRHDVLTAWAMGNAGYQIDADYRESCRYQPHIEVDEKLWGKRLEWYRAWVSNTRRNDEYWNTGFWNMLKEIPGKVSIPVHIGEGWFDHHLTSAIETYRALPEECRRKSELLIGAWNHDFNIKLQDKHGENFKCEEVSRTFDWFYNILVKEQIPEGKIDTYIINDDNWHSRKAYEPEDKKEYRFYLSKGKVSGEYALNREAPETDNVVEFHFNPENPVESHGAESMLETKEKVGSLRQPEPNYREDVISFISEPLEEDIVIMGSICVKLAVETDAEDTAFVVKVMEIDELGRAYNMRTGITTLEHRGHCERRQKYVPGTVVEIMIDMWDLAWKLRRGTKLRIDVTSSDFPQYCVHSNYAGGWAQQVENRQANQKIYFGQKYESVVILPCVELDKQ